MKGLPVSEILLFLCHHRILMSHRICTSCVELSPKNNKGKVTIGTNHRPTYASGKHLQFEYQNTHLKAEENFEQIRRSIMPVQGIIAFEK